MLTYALEHALELATIRWTNGVLWIASMGGGGVSELVICLGPKLFKRVA
jgi:hypothetical protein